MTWVCVTIFAKRVREIETITYVCVTSLIERRVNDIMCAVVINIEAYMENNLQRESFSILFKLFRVIFFVYKFEEKLKHEIKIKIKM